MSKVNTMTDIVVQSLAWFGGFVFFVMRLDKRLSVLETKVDDLRERQEKYNHLQERMTKVEDRSASNTHRLDDLYMKRRGR